MEYTTLSEKAVNRICKDYSIGQISAFEVLSGGSENTNYLLTSSTGRYVLSICEQKSMEEAIQLAQLLTYLHKHHFHTSRIIRNKFNQMVVTWEEKPVMLKSYLEGTVKRELSPHLIQLIGRELGNLHQIPAPDYLPRQLNFGREKFILVKTYAPDSTFDHWLQDILAFLTPYFELNLPRALIHADIFWNNVIIGRDRQSVAIMDFEEAANYYRVFDIGMTIIGICSVGDVIDLKKVAHLLQGYNEEVALEETELEALQAFTVYAGASMTFWRHMNFNYVNPNPKMADHYMGLQVLTDFVKDLDDYVLAEMIRS